MNGFPQRLRTLRERHGWSQEHVGFELGVTKATVSKWETGRAEPSLRHLSLIRRLYADDGASLDYLIDGVAQAHGVLHASPGTLVADPDESALLRGFRTLSPPRRRALVTLLDGD